MLRLPEYILTTGVCRTASRGLLLRRSATLCLALLQLLPRAVGLDRHILLRISKLLHALYYVSSENAALDCCR